MAIIKRRPLTPAQRYTELSRAEVDNKRPERSLVESKHRAKGRNCYGRITCVVVVVVIRDCIV